MRQRYSRATPLLLPLALLAFGCAAAGRAGPTRPAFTTSAEGLRPTLIAVRRDLHRHPELSGGEQRTAARVAARLRALGLEVRTGVGGHGVVEFELSRQSDPQRNVARLMKPMLKTLLAGCGASTTALRRVDTLDLEFQQGAHP